MAIIELKVIGTIGYSGKEDRMLCMEHDGRDLPTASNTMRKLYFSPTDKRLVYLNRSKEIREFANELLSNILLGAVCTQGRSPVSCGYW